MRPLLLAWVLAQAVSAQVAGPANERYQTREQRQGIAKGLARPGRDATQKPRELVDGMALKPGMTVADIGTGAGYMLPYLSRAVGPGGRVLAEDIFDEFLDQARRKAESEKLANVTFVKGGVKDAALPERAVDVALALDSYHHYDYPAEMLASIRKGLKPGGRLFIVEYHKKPDAIPGCNAMEHIRLDQAGVAREVEAAGFTLVAQHEHIPGSQYVLVFVRGEAN